MKVSERVCITFTRDSWKVHQTESKAWEWIEEQIDKDRWSLTPGRVTFCLPGPDLEEEDK